MENKNKAEELSKKLFINHAQGIDSGDFGSGIQYWMNESDLLNALNEYNNSRQSEIDELTKEVERLRKEKQEVIDALTNLEHRIMDDETINDIRCTMTNAEARRIILTTH